MLQIEQNRGKDYQTNQTARTASTNNYNHTANPNKGSGALVAVVAVMAVFLLLIAGFMYSNMQKMQDDLEEMSKAQETVIVVPQTPTAEEVTEEAKEPETEKEEEKIVSPLSTMPSVVGNFSDVFTQGNNLQDNLGNVYENGYAFLTGKEITYMLNGEYDWLEGTIAVAMEDKDRLNFACVYVYDENSNKIYESEWIERSKHPEPVTVRCNVSGLKRVTVEFAGCTQTAGRLRMVTEGLSFTN